MARRIKIRWKTSHYVLHKDDGYRVRMWVDCATEMPEEIFVYREMPTNPATGERAGFFSHIASPVDLEEMPANAPRAGEIPEWFRLNVIDIMVRSTAEAQGFIDDVLEDVCRLKQSLDRLDVIAPAGAYDCGEQLICSSSSSSSSSASASSQSSSSESTAAKVRCCAGTTEIGVGYGQPWVDVGLGAGSPIGSSDSVSSYGRNISQTTLLCGLVSQQLLIQGYGCFDDIPDDAVIDGIEATLELRWDRTPNSGSSSSSGSSASAAPEPYDGPQLAYFRLYHPTLGPVGDDKAMNDPITGPAWQQIVFGSPADQWGTSLTGKDLKSGEFGVMLIVFLPANVNMAVVQVDGVELCAHWRD